MSDLYIAVLEINRWGICKKTNRKVDADSILYLDGFECQLVSFDEKSFGLKVYVHSQHAARYLFAAVDNSGIEIGGKYNDPTLLIEDGKFSDFMCAYIFAVSNQPIMWEEMYRSAGIDADWRTTPESFQILVDRMSQMNRVVYAPEPVPPEQNGISVSMDVVYASPAMMPSGTVVMPSPLVHVENTSKTYPRIHAEDPDTTMQQCPHCGAFIPMGKFCPRCGNSTTAKRCEQKPSVVPVYASPEPPKRIEKKESFFAKLIKRK